MNKEIFRNKSNEIENLKQIGKEKIKDINVLNNDKLFLSFSRRISEDVQPIKKTKQFLYLFLFF
jgi:aspartate ammonia-lyase